MTRMQNSNPPSHLPHELCQGNQFGRSSEFLRKILAVVYHLFSPVWIYACRMNQIDDLYRMWHTTRLSVNFVAIDVETACADRSSICQIGIAEFQQGQMIRCEGILLNPETEFSAFNSNLHGIAPAHVAGSPTWKTLYPALSELLSNRVLVSHTYFDRFALQSVCQRYRVEMFPYAKWIDSCQIARKAWPQLANHKLTNLAECFNIKYRAHDAAEDARVAGEILLLANAVARAS